LPNLERPRCEPQPEPQEDRYIPRDVQSNFLVVETPLPPEQKSFLAKFCGFSRQDFESVVFEVALCGNEWAHADALRGCKILRSTLRPGDVVVSIGPRVEHVIGTACVGYHSFYCVTFVTLPPPLGRIEFYSDRKTRDLTASLMTRLLKP